MNDSQIVERNRDPEQETRINDLVVDGLYTDLRVAQLRITDLEATNTGLRELLHVALDTIRAHTTRERQLTARLRRLTASTQQIRQAA